MKKYFSIILLLCLIIISPVFSDEDNKGITENNMIQLKENPVKKNKPREQNKNEVLQENNIIDIPQEKAEKENNRNEQLDENNKKDLIENINKDDNINNEEKNIKEKKEKKDNIKNFGKAANSVIGTIDEDNNLRISGNGEIIRNKWMESFYKTQKFIKKTNTIKFINTGDVYFPKNSAYLFIQNNAEKIELNNNVNLDKCTTIKGMFQESKVTDIEFGGLDLAVVPKIDRLFYGLSLNELDLSHFDWSDNKNMNKVFENSNIDHLYLGGNFNIRADANIDDIFNNLKFKTLKFTNNGDKGFNIASGNRMYNIYKNEVYYDTIKPNEDYFFSPENSSIEIRESKNVIKLNLLNNTSDNIFELYKNNNKIKNLNPKNDKIIITDLSNGDYIIYLDDKEITKFTIEDNNILSYYEYEEDAFVYTFEIDLENMLPIIIKTHDNNKLNFETEIKLNKKRLNNYILSIPINKNIEAKLNNIKFKNVYGETIDIEDINNIATYKIEDKKIIFNINDINNNLKDKLKNNSNKLYVKFYFTIKDIVLEENEEQILSIYNKDIDIYSNKVIVKYKSILENKDGYVTKAEFILKDNQNNKLLFLEDNKFVYKHIDYIDKPQNSKAYRFISNEEGCINLINLNKDIFENDEYEIIQVKYTPFYYNENNNHVIQSNNLDIINVTEVINNKDIVMPATGSNKLLTHIYLFSICVLLSLNIYIKQKIEGR